MSFRFGMWFMTLCFGQRFEFAGGLGGLFLKLPGMGQVWVDRGGVLWDR